LDHTKTPDTMTEAIKQSDSYDVKIAKQTPISVELKRKEEKAIVECLHIAKKTIDNMHPFEREVHDFDREDIREIEKQLRGKLKNKPFKGWHTVELTDREVKAIEGGLTDMLFSDNHEQKKRHIRVSKLLTHHLTV